MARGMDDGERAALAVKGAEMMRLGKLRKGPQMKKTAALLAGVIVPLVAGMGIATSSNAQSATNDEAYCVALVNEYTHGGIERGFSPESLDTSVAINQCRDGIRGRRSRCLS